jgi:outer membrane immunogenic protein
MNKTLITSAIFGALIAGSAMAADMPVKAPMLMKAPPPAFSWTGCYISGGIGYGMWNQDHSITTDNGVVANAITTTETTGGGRGWLGRAGVGCDYQVASSWVIGAFGDYDWMDLKGSMSTGLTNGGFATSADEKESWAWSAGARLGYLIAPTILTYVDGGWTETRFDQMNIVRSNGLPNPTPNGFPAHTYQGWFIGSGFEYAFTWLPINGLFVRTEYRYSTYQKDDLTEFVLASGAPSGNFGVGNTLHSSKQVQTITSSLVWRFNFGH